MVGDTHLHKSEKLSSESYSCREFFAPWPIIHISDNVSAIAINISFQEGFTF